METIYGPLYSRDKYTANDETFHAHSNDKVTQTHIMLTHAHLLKFNNLQMANNRPLLKTIGLILQPITQPYSVVLKPSDFSRYSVTSLILKTFAVGFHICRGGIFVGDN